jgi:hypothetical protein
MTGTEDMELLEREPPLASLAGFAAEARRGEGRLVLLGGEAGVGKTALVEPPSSIFFPKRASCHAPATALSPR